MRPQTIREGAEASGYVVKGFAPHSKATGQLRKAGIEATALPVFLARGQNDPSADTANRHLFMLEESSLASTRQMRSFLGKLNRDDRALALGSLADWLTTGKRSAPSPTFHGTKQSPA